MTQLNDMLQRMFDVLFSTIALIILFPFFILIALLLRFTGEGEILFFQERVGKGGKIFRLIKFVTMLKNSPNMSLGTITIRNDPRVLPLGRFLRKTKINELPQLINVLRGDVSLIGPRPQTKRCFNAFPKSTQDAIVKVKPGLSGIGSVIFRNEEEMLEENKMDNNRFYDEIIAPYKGKLEEWYVANRNIYLYFMLLFLTVWIVIFPHSRIYKRILKDIPDPPKELERWL